MQPLLGQPGHEPYEESAIQETEPAEDTYQAI